MPNDKLTEIIAVLDRSGSMAGRIEDVIGGFNMLVEKQRAVPGECNITLVIFDDKIEKLYEARDVKEVGVLAKDVFYARNMTALNDALGSAVVQAGERFAALPEEQRPGKVIVFVSTDGLENASTEFPHRGNAALRKIIEVQQDEFSWQFIFAGADIDAVAESSANYATPVGNALNYAKSAEGTSALYRGVSAKIAQLRQREVVSCAFTDEEREEVEKHVTGKTGKSKTGSPGSKSGDSGVTPSATVSSTS